MSSNSHNKTAHETEKSGKHMLSGTVRIFLAEALILPTGFITAVYLARKLGPDQYGLFALLSQFILWIEWSSVSAFMQATIKSVGQAEDWRPVSTAITRLHLFVGCLLTVILWIFAPLIARLFQDPNLAGTIALFAIEIPFFGLRTANRNILIGMRRFKERSLLSVFHIMSRLILILLFVEMGLSLRGAILGTIGASIVEWSLSLIFIRPSLFSRQPYPMRRLWSICIPVYFTNLSLRCFNVDLFALKAFGGTALQVGLYSVAQNLSVPIKIVSQSFSLPLLSTITHLRTAGDQDAAKRISSTSMRSILWFIPFTVLVAFTSTDLIVFIFGQTYAPAAPILSLLIFSSLGWLSINICNAILIGIDKSYWALSINSLLVPLAIIGYYLFIPTWNMVGAAWVISAVSCFGGILGIIIACVAAHIRFPVSTLMRAALSSFAVYAMTTLWDVNNTFILCKLLTITSIIPVSFILLGEFCRQEKQWFLSLILRRQPTC